MKYSHLKNVSISIKFTISKIKVRPCIHGWELSIKFLDREYHTKIMASTLYFWQ